MRVDGKVKRWNKPRIPQRFVGSQVSSELPHRSRSVDFDDQAVSTRTPLDDLTGGAVALVDNQHETLPALYCLAQEVGHIRHPVEETALEEVPDRAQGRAVSRDPWPRADGRGSSRCSTGSLYTKEVSLGRSFGPSRDRSRVRAPNVTHASFFTRTERRFAGCPGPRDPAIGAHEKPAQPAPRCRSGLRSATAPGTA